MHLENAAMLQKMEVISGLEGNDKKAAAYKKVFGDCCESSKSEEIAK